jgi:hypothetical protein
MVRAAASGAINYAGADPYDRSWRLKHRLLLQEIHRREEHALLDCVHRHWCAYLSHGGLTEESFSQVKASATETLTSIEDAIFPWASPKDDAEAETKNSTMDPETQALIDKYKRMTEKHGE